MADPTVTARIPRATSYRQEELAATIYYAVHIPLNAPQDNIAISRPRTTGKPVMDRFGQPLLIWPDLSFTQDHVTLRP